MVREREKVVYSFLYMWRDLRRRGREERGGGGGGGGGKREREREREIIHHHHHIEHLTISRICAAEGHVTSTVDVCCCWAGPQPFTLCCTNLTIH